MSGGKHIIICSDGTGNQSNKGRGTNVFKIFEAIDNSGHHLDGTLTRQIAFYDDGVGTSKFAPIRMIGGALGLGVARNVRQLYCQICRCYKPGDKIFMFGFSRGAYTVRTLASIVIECGIVDLNSAEKIPVPFLKPGTDLWLRWISWRAWRAHRRQFKSMLDYLLELVLKGTPAEATENLRKRYSVDRDTTERVRVHFIGVWDTVGAVGLPFDFLTWFINTFIYRFSFPNQELNLRVEKACQALAVDEERASFKPIMWRESDDDRLDEMSGFRRRVTKLCNRILRKNRQAGPTPGYNVAQPCQCALAASRKVVPEAPQRDASEPPAARIEQVWFPGVHSDIGGGYPKQGLSFVTLDWMMEKADACGLRLSAAARAMVKEQRNVFDKLHNSRAGFGTVYRYKPRNLVTLCEDNHARLKIHGAGLERIIDERNYRPALVSCDAEVVKTPYEVVRDIDSTQACVKNAKAATNLNGWIYSRIALHWVFMAVLFWVLYLAQQHAEGWINLGKGVLDMWSSPIEALKTFILTPLKLDDWYWGKWVGGALLLLALLSKIVQIKITSIQSTFWNNVFSKNGAAT